MVESLNWLGSPISSDVTTHGPSGHAPWNVLPCPNRTGAIQTHALSVAQVPPRTFPSQREARLRNEFHQQVTTQETALESCLAAVPRGLGEHHCGLDAIADWTDQPVAKLRTGVGQHRMWLDMKLPVPICPSTRGRDARTRGDDRARTKRRLELDSAALDGLVGSLDPPLLAPIEGHRAHDAGVDGYQHGCVVGMSY